MTTQRLPLIIDHDLGSNPDDIFALQFALGSERANLLFLISGNQEPLLRAQLGRAVLDLLGHPEIVSYVGETTGVTPFFAAQHVTGSERVSYDYVDAVRLALAQYSGTIRYLAIQGLSNVARLFAEIPEAKERLEIVHLGLTTTEYEIGTDGGTNMRADPRAAAMVYTEAKHLVSVGLQTTLRDELRVSPQSGLHCDIQSDNSRFGALLRQQLDEFHTRRGLWPALHDPLAAAVALNYPVVNFQRVQVVFMNDGRYRKALDGEQGILVTTSLPEIDARAFLALQRALSARSQKLSS